MIVFLADDMGYGDSATYAPAGGIPTPALDRLAREGMLFTDAHSSASVCSPSRYGLLTGRYAWRTALHGNLNYFEEPLIERERLTIAEMLRRRGYTTAAIGKWHLGLSVPGTDGGFARAKGRELPEGVDFTAEIVDGPLDHGFDAYFGQPGSPVRAFVENRRFREVPVLDRERKVYEAPGWEEPQKGVIELEWALQFLERERDRPFFLYFAAHGPHGPFEPTDRLDGRPVAGQSGRGGRGDLVVQNDVVLGMILGKLDELGLARTTLVFFTSDNGAHTKIEEQMNYAPNGELRGGKGLVYEGGHRVPLVVRWGDGTPAGSTIAPGSVTDQLAGLQNLMATLADIVGFELPADAAEDSESFLSVLRGSPASPRTSMVHHGGRYALREARWKFADSQGGQVAEELYDLARDEREANDLVATRPEVAARLRAQLEGLRSRPTSATRLDVAQPD